MPTFTDGNLPSAARSLLNTYSGLTTNIKNAAVDYYKFQLLYNNVYNKLTKALQYYSEQDYENLLRDFSDNEIPNLINLINNNDFYNNNNDVNTITNVVYDITLFDSYKRSTLNIITGLQGSLQINNTNKILKDNETGLKQYETALNIKNKEFILNYINSNLNYIQTPTDIINAFELEIEIQPWYSEYLIQWGPPNNGVFDTVKLTNIVNALINDPTSGVTLDQFLNSNGL
jgi:hypothetical protein